MKAIVSVDLNWAIGGKGDLLLRIPDDMRRFKKMTLGKVVVMGRETFNSLPGQVPLKDRINIALSRNKDFKAENLIVCHSMKEAAEEFKKYDNDDICIIGGEEIYKQFLPYCDEVYITRIENTYPADKHLPILDEDDNWEIISTSDTKEYTGINYRYIIYKNKAVKTFTGE